MTIGTEYEINTRTAIFRSTFESGTIAEHTYDGSVLTISAFGGSEFGEFPIEDLVAVNRKYRAWQRLVREKLTPTIEPRPLYDANWSSARDRIRHSFETHGMQLSKLDWRRGRGIRIEERPLVAVTWAVGECWTAALARFFNTAALACTDGGAGIDEVVVEDVADLVL